jgi:N-acetylglucosamine kinase-like BadF-type ATPase
MRRSLFFLGIDAGATKTHALVADDSGHVLGLGQAGPGNWEGVGLDGARLVYTTAIEKALAEAGLRVGQLCAAGYGLAGMDWPSDEARLGAVLDRLGVPGPRILVNDAYAALRAGTRSGYGVAAIAGTGTTVAGCNAHGERFRTFGEGMGLGDIGGAGDIVFWALRAAALAYTGRGQPTALTERFLALYGLESFAQLAEKLCRHEVEPPRAALAPMVFEVAEAGDGVARDVLHFVGYELGANAAAVARRLGLAGTPFELVLAGGVFRAQSSLFVSAVLEAVRAESPAVQPIILHTAPVVGSVLLGMEAAGLTVAAEVHDRLAAETRARLQGPAR